MSQQYPHQPGGAPPQQQWGAPPPPQPKKKGSAGKILGFGCLGVVALFVILGIAATGGSNSSGSGATATSQKNSGSHAKSGDSQADKAADTVVFKVWGTAPSGAAGPLDITYGSDSDNRQGHWKQDGFTATLPLHKGALYYSLTAQLAGSGDIHCSVTIGGTTKTGHASGGYNICSAQLNSGFDGDWEG
ncbi:hypothetical protein [Streptomyces sp. NPDC054834]